MKTILATLMFLSFTFASFSQTDNEKREGKLLESLGVYSASYLFTAQNFMNTIKVAHSSKGYTSTQASEKISLFVILLETVIKDSKSLEKEGLKDPSDVDFVKATIAIFENMKDQGKALQKYIDDGSSTALDEYNKLDSSNWNDIYDLLGID